MCFYQEIAGECCPYFKIEYYCNDPLSLPTSRCSKYVCLDGTEGTPFCGYGPCDMFRCDCAGGCRRGTEKSARQKFQMANPNIAFVFVSTYDLNPKNRKKCATCEEQ